MNKTIVPKILLMDDSDLARKIGRVALRSAGYVQVEEASSGQSALNMLSAPGCDIDVVLCDLMMPEMDGIQFIRHAADLSRRPALIFVSGGESALLQGAQDTARARNLRVLGTVKKPITAESISHLLKRFPEPEQKPRNTDALEIIQDMEYAIAERQFLLHYQPKISISGRKLVGVEALVRWQHPEHGLLPPGAFIGAAEKSGKIKALTEQIATLALEQCAKWSIEGFIPKVSVNLSAYMLVDLDFPDRIAGKAEELGIDTQQIVLEITESGLFQDLANTLEILTRLRMKGFTLSIDDFGTGYSSMDQLRKVPFAELKIDRAFVNGASENEKARAILDGTVQLGRALNMTVVAEGAETQEDWNILEAAGVDTVQGYFIAKPMPADTIQKWNLDREES